MKRALLQRGWRAEPPQNLLRAVSGSDLGEALSNMPSFQPKMETGHTRAGGGGGGLVPSQFGGGKFGWRNFGGSKEQGMRHGACNAQRGREDGAGGPLIWRGELIEPPHFPRHTYDPPNPPPPPPHSYCAFCRGLGPPKQTLDKMSHGGPGLQTLPQKRPEATCGQRTPRGVKAPPSP